MHKKINNKHTEWMKDSLKTYLFDESDFLVDVDSLDKGFFYIQSKIGMALPKYEFYERKELEKFWKSMLEGRLNCLNAEISRILKRINDDELKDEKYDKVDPFSKEFESWDKDDLIRFVDYNLLFPDINIRFFKSFSKENMIKWIRKSYLGDEVDIEIFIDLRNYKHLDLENVLHLLYDVLGKVNFPKWSMYEMACIIANQNPNIDYDVIHFLTISELKKICDHNKILGYKNLNYKELHKLLLKQKNLNFDCVTEDGFFEIPWFNNDKQDCKNLLIKWWNK